ncbi:unnamed protein product [Rodentolepis nana]|uniref:Cysteine-rich and transmembrane domain-containing protein 1 n=1 Tax=Rodentolepis nana TaxID=102285 RepID=A0A0R3TUZ1_RODNA|nr:unnamed protein product [Rodentolepis nana]
MTEKDLGQPPPYTETAPPYPMPPGHLPPPGYGPAPGYPPPAPGYPPPGPGYPPPGPGYPHGPSAPQPVCVEVIRLYYMNGIYPES